jgi:hypothetical protein
MFQCIHGSNSVWLRRHLRLRGGVVESKPFYDAKRIGVHHNIYIDCGTCVELDGFYDFSVCRALFLGAACSLKR